MKPGARHPEPMTLALLAGGDLGWSEALGTRWHVRLCPQCKRQLEEFRADRMALGAATASEVTPAPGEDGIESDSAWNLLEAEMRANVRLGLTAGSLASGPAESGLEAEDAAQPAFSPAPWRWAVVCGALAFVMTAGWWLHSAESTPPDVASAPVWKTPAAERVGHVSGQNARMQLLVPVADVSRTETDFDGSTRSRVIDGETGQVTLQQVYVE